MIIQDKDPLLVEEHDPKLSFADKEAIKNENASRVARDILRTGGVTPPYTDKHAVTLVCLKNTIAEMPEINNLAIDDDITYFDLGLVWEASKLATPKAFGLINSDIVSDVIELCEIAAEEQVQKWRADLAQLIDTQLSETIYELEILFDHGQKVSKLKITRSSSFWPAILLAPVRRIKEK